MRLSRWWLTGFLSMLAGACNGGLLIGDGPDGGPTTTTTGGGGSSTSSGGSGGAMTTGGGGSILTTASSGVGGSMIPMTSGGGGSSMSTGAGGSIIMTSGSGGGMTTGTGGAGGGGPDACPGMSFDAEFSMLQLDNTPLGRVYDVWGAGEGDYYVALGVETASWPNTSQLTALAHNDGSHWTLERLPPTTGIAQLTGTELLTPGGPVSNLWALAGVQSSQLQAAVLRGSGAAGMHMWTSETVLDPGYGLVALGIADAILSVYTHSNAFIGEVRRYNGTQWVNMDLPDVGVPYAFRKLRMRDATHVYGVGYSGGANMGSHVIGAFDGTKWSAHLVDDKCGNLEDVVGVAPDRIYTLGTDYTAMKRRVCRVSPDLATWTVIDDLPYAGGDNPTIVASGTGGTIVAIVGTYMSHGPSLLRFIRNDMLVESCNMTPGLGAFTAWSAPGSNILHIFSGEQAGVTKSFARHIARVLDM
jgi:hypothetical protein